jgi:uncharacterized membrane protein
VKTEFGSTRLQLFFDSDHEPATAGFFMIGTGLDMLDGLSGWLQVGLTIVQILLAIWQMKHLPRRKKSSRSEQIKTKEYERTVIEYTDEQS